jgi:hypothetical protein
MINSLTSSFISLPAPLPQVSIIPFLRIFYKSELIFFHFLTFFNDTILNYS